eukprot:g27669.t1
MGQPLCVTEGILICIRATIRIRDRVIDINVTLAKESTQILISFGMDGLVAKMLRLCSFKHRSIHIKFPEKSSTHIDGLRARVLLARDAAAQGPTAASRIHVRIDVDIRHLDYHNGSVTDPAKYTVLNMARMFSYLDWVAEQEWRRLKFLDESFRNYDCANASSI